MMVTLLDRIRKRLPAWLGIVLFLSCLRIDGRRSLFDGTDLPRLKDTDAIELYHLRSFPSMVLDTDFGVFSTQTSGLALRSTTTDTVVVLQYKPKNYSTSFLPRLLTSVVDESTVVGLSWDKRAEIIYHDNIDTSFWQQSTFLARINGVVYKNYVKWLEQYIRHHGVFRPQSICSNEFDINACFILADTWDTFLADSFHLFAALSVRINAIIPPRATELKIISGSEPILVRMANASEEYFDRNEYEKRRRHPAQDDDQPHHDIGGDDYPFPGNEGEGSNDPNINSNEREQNNDENRWRLLSPEILRRRIAEKDFPTSPTTTPTNVTAVINSTSDSSSSQPDILTIHADEILRYYNKLLSCMQEYQQSDFTVALKSCTAEDVAFVHVDGDLYWQITPRYPFIFLHDYLQIIPAPEYRSDPGVDAVDWSLVGFFIVTVLLGCFSTMYQIKIWELFLQGIRRCCGICMPNNNTSDPIQVTNYNSGSPGAEEYFSPSRRERQQRSIFQQQHQKMPPDNELKNSSSLQRLWGAFISYRGRSVFPSHGLSGRQSSSSPAQHPYAKLNQREEVDEDDGGNDETGTEMIGFL